MKHWLVAALLFVVVTAAPAQVSPEFFGMHTGWHPWPTQVGVQFSSWRSLASMVDWSDVNTAPGVYDWTRLDLLFSFTQQYGQSVMYTLYYTPSWASSCPHCACRPGQFDDGGCYPPNDLNADGSGTDQHLKDYIAALVQHVGPGKIQYIEVWNEANISSEYAGTLKQLVRMTKDVREVAQAYDPNIKISSPAETGDGLASQDWERMKCLGEFLAAGGGDYVDVIGLHGYVQNPEDIIQRVNNTAAVMQQYGQGGKPIFVTEGGWAYPKGSQFPVAQEPGFSFRHYLSMLSTPVQRFYLFYFSAPNEGNFFDRTTNALTPNATAYKLYYKWLVGATITQPCQEQAGGNGVWSCTFTRAQGYQAEAIWDTAVPFGKTVTVTVPSQYVKYRDLYGGVYPISNHLVAVGYSPIWLENGN